MRSKLQRPKVAVCTALGYPATLVAAAVLLLALGAHRFEGKTSQQRVSATLARRTGGATAFKAQLAARARAVDAYGAAVSEPSTIMFGSSAAATNNSGSPTIAIPTFPAWASALPGSTWISYTEGVVPNATGNCTLSFTPGCVTFTKTFVTPAAGFSGFVRVTADDSTSVVLNGIQLMPEATRVGNFYRTCSDFPIGCLATTRATIHLDSLPAGTNTLSFTVAQRGGGPFGLDFAAR